MSRKQKKLLRKKLQKQINKVKPIFLRKRKIKWVKKRGLLMDQWTSAILTLLLT